MSIQAVAAVLEADVGEVAAKMLLICLANAHNASTGLCSPSIKRLELESGMARSSVKKWLVWLTNHGIIEIEERHNDAGRQISNQYRLTFMGEGPNSGRGRDLTPTEGPNFGRGRISAPSERSAPRGAELSAPYKPEEEPENYLSGARARPGWSALRMVLDDEHTGALLDHFDALGHPLTDYTAGLKAQQLATAADPNAASRTMIEKGWMNFDAHWTGKPRRASKGESGTEPVPTTKFVHAERAAHTWAWCCAETGHAPTLTDDRGGWHFPIEVTDRYLRHMAGEVGHA